MARVTRKIPLKPRVALVGDGYTEQIYFTDLKDKDRPADLDLYPNLPKRSGSFKGVLDTADQLVKDYSRVYALIDMDKVISDRTEAAYDKAKKKSEKLGVIVLENNPCFEFWLLLHFVKTAKSFTTCDDVIAELKKTGRLPGYDKSQRFQVAAKLYGNYKERIHTHAMPAAAALEKDRPADNKYYPGAEVFKFFEWYFSPDRIALLNGA